MNEYDVRKAFEEMELELIASMKRNLQRHLDWEKDEGFNWDMWQVEQLKTLENFKKENQKIFNKKFSSINAEIANFLKNTYETTGFKAEAGILDELAKGLIVNENIKKGIDNSFFSLNKKKMNALIKATTDDMEKAEHAMLRRVNDQYRKTIFNAQVMANSGAFTLPQSVDKATKDFLRAGINCIQYKNGRRVNIASYAEMAIRTANKRAVLISEGDTRNAYGIHTVRISRYGGCSETCLPWQGKVYVDDVYSGGTKEEAQEKNLTLLSEAIAGGLFHPNCKHRATTYFYDLKKEMENLDEKGLENPPEEQEHRKNKLHIQQQKRIEAGSLDRDNAKQAKIRKEQWEEKDKKLRYSDDWLPFRFSGKTVIKKYNNPDELVEKIVNNLSIDKNITNVVKSEFKIIPEDALNFLVKNDVKILRSFDYTYYDGDKHAILINTDKYETGMLAHELGHALVETNGLYKNRELKNIMLNVLKNAEIKSRKYQGESYITLKSDLFIRPYQGRTYIKTDDFVNKRLKINYTDLEEYVSVGYETFVTDPQLLHDKDKRLYDFIKKGGLCNG